MTNFLNRKTNQKGKTENYSSPAVGFKASPLGSPKSQQGLRPSVFGPMGQERPNLARLSLKIDYKNVILLKNFITFEGKIVPRRISKLSAKQQRYMSRAIKNARLMGLLPFINKQRPMG